MTEPTEPQPRDIALEQEMPEQAAGGRAGRRILTGVAG